MLMLHSVSHDLSKYWRELEGVPTTSSCYDKTLPVWVVPDQKVAIESVAIHTDSPVCDGGIRERWNRTAQEFTGTSFMICIHCLPRFRVHTYSLPVVCHLDTSIR
jgi:hypothetical protein|tara:strand:+ start:1549 stop:1863 length:315 start_codon:yes stop_codon:yes gene_type:complete